MKITDEQLDKAVEFVNQKYKIDGGHFEIARSEKYHNETLMCFKEFFFKDEPICASLELTWNDVIMNMTLPIIQQNMTLIAVDDTTGEVMGIRIIAATNKQLDASMMVCGNGKMTKLTDFTDYVKNNSDFYNKYGVTEAFEFVALAVNRKYRKMGLGTKLMSGAIDMLRFCKPDIQYIKSLASSKFSQAIFEKVGFENVYEVYYKDYMVDGEILINNAGVHKKIVQYVLRL